VQSLEFDFATLLGTSAFSYCFNCGTLPGRRLSLRRHFGLALSRAYASPAKNARKSQV